MGMDLSPKVEGHDLHFNWNGWSEFTILLERWGVNTDEFVHHNDGDPISNETCKRIADELERHLPSMNERDQRWLRPMVNAFRNCGGMEQW